MKKQIAKYTIFTLIAVVISLITNNCYAMNSGENSGINVPSCTYQINYAAGDRTITGNITISYYKNSVKLWDSSNNKTTSSVTIGDKDKVNLGGTATSMFKETGTSFFCPSSINAKVSESGSKLNRKYKFTITTKATDATFNITSDNSIVDAVQDGEFVGKNKVEACSSAQLTKLKNELNLNFESELNTPVYERLKELSNLGKYSNTSNGQPVLTTVSVVKSKTSEIINYYNLLLTGNYEKKKTGIVDKYRSACKFDSDIEPLSYIANREKQLMLGIKNIGKNKTSQAKTWMQEEKIDSETIREQTELYEKKVDGYLDNLQKTLTNVEKSTNSTIDDANNEQKTLAAECGMLSELMPYIQKIFNWIKVGVPIALIIFGIFDFATPILSNDKEALGKASSRFIKRCIVAIIIFFVPLLVNYLLKVFNNATGNNTSTCGLANIVLNLRR